MPKIEIAKLATLTGHTDCIYVLEKSGLDNYFFSSGGDGMVVSWDFEKPENGELIAKVTNSVYALHYLEGRDELLIGENFEGIHKVDLRKKKENKSSKIGLSAFFDIKSYGDKVYVASGDGSLIVLDKEDLSTIGRIKLSDHSARCIAINEQRKEIAVGYSDNVCRIFDLERLELIAAFQAHQNSIFTVIYSPDNKFLLTAGRDAYLKIWDSEQGCQLKESIVAHMYAINHVAYSPNGKYFATCSMDKSIKIWDAREFKLLKVIDKSRHTGHGTSINKLFWSAYKNQLVSCSDDRTISIWDIKNLD